MAAKPSKAADKPSGERLQKVLANAGLGSRREIERWIAAGEVSVDGKPAILGCRVSGDEAIAVRGRPVKPARLRPQHQTIAYHKPEGELVTRRDEKGRPTVFQKLPRPESGRWVAVGRLDLNTSGLLLLTTDGALADRLMHPANQVQREYAVRVRGTVDAAMIERLVSGVALPDGKARFEDVVDSGGSGQNHWFHVVICEGRNREVRRLWESQGVSVSRLKRVRYGPIGIAGLRVGKARALTRDEIKQLDAIEDVRQQRATAAD